MQKIPNNRKFVKKAYSLDLDANKNINSDPIISSVVDNQKTEENSYPLPEIQEEKDNRDSFERELSDSFDLQEVSKERKLLYNEIQFIINFKENTPKKHFKFAKNEKNNNSDSEEENELYRMKAKEYYHYCYENERENSENKENNEFYVLKKSDFELWRDYSDPYILLQLRKNIFFIKNQICIISFKISSNVIFDPLMLVIVFINSVFIIREPDNSPEIYFLSIYTIEMILKMLSKGLILSEDSYFRKGWNWLDFLIVVLGYTELNHLSLGLNLSSIRILRILKSIKAIDGLNKLIRALISALPLFLDTLTILAIFYFIFSITGLHLFQGKFKNRCFNEFSGIEYNFNYILPYLCGGADYCPENYICGKLINNPRFNTVNFDNFFYSNIMIFQILTLQGWTYIMFQAFSSISIFTVIYFIFVVFIGSFFLMNLLLAVIKVKFTETNSRHFKLVKIIKRPKVDILDLKLFKKLERTHYKRVSQRKTQENIKKNIEGQRKSVKIFEVADFTEKVKEQQAKEMKDLDKKRHNFPLKTLIIQKIVKQKQNNISKVFQKFEKKDFQKKTFKNGLFLLEFNKKKPIDDHFYGQSIDFLNEINEHKPIPQKINLNERTLSLETLKFKPKMLSIKAKTTNENKETIIETTKNNENSLLNTQKSLLDQPAFMEESMNNNENNNENKNDDDFYQDPDFNDAFIANERERFAKLRLKIISKTNKPSENIIKTEDKLKKTPFWMESKLNQSNLEAFFKNSYEKPTGNQIKNSSVKNKDEIINKTKNRENLRKYKIMVDFTKRRVFDSEDDVLAFRILREKQKLEEEKKKIRKKNIPIIYNINIEKKSKIKNLSIKLPLNLKKNIFFKEPNSVINKLENIKRNYGNIQLSSNNLFSDFSNKVIENSHFSSEIRSKNPKSPKKSLKSPKKSKKNLNVITYSQARLKIREKLINNKIELQNYEVNYDKIIEKDYIKGTKVSLVWSGNDIFFNENINKTKQICKSLNKIDKNLWLKNFRGKRILISKCAKNIVESNFFDNIIQLCIAFNVSTLCFETFYMNHSIFSIFNFIFVVFFLIEMTLKIISSGIKYYLKDKYNLFDAIIVILSLIEIVDGTGKFKILRIFRVLRIIRLLRLLPFMKKIVSVVSYTLKDFIYIFIMLLLFIFMYSLFGYKIFADQFHEAEYRESFDSFQKTFVTVFQILSKSYWFRILDLSYNSNINKFFGTFFVISWILIGNYILLNLFLAILLDGFNIAENEKEGEVEEFEKLEENKEELKEINEKKSKNKIERTITFMDEIKTEKQNKSILKNEFKNTPFFIFGKNNVFRKMCYIIVKSHYFDYFIMIIIVANCVKLIIDTYLTGENYSKISLIVDYIFTMIFFLEIIIKSIVHGILIGKDAYLRDYWNLMDFFIVITSIIDIFVANINLPVIKIFRLFRTLRPLRFISHNVNMKIVVVSLLDSFGSIMNVIVVILIVWLLFGLLGVYLLADKLGYCGIEEYYGVSQQQCLLQGFEWKTRHANFDNILNSLISLFIISSLEGWPDLMWYCLDADYPENGPSKDNFEYISYYYIIFLFIGSFFFVNLFVGVLFFHFGRAHKSEKTRRHLFLTDEQAKWLDIQKMIAKARPDFKIFKKPTRGIRKILFNIVNLKNYDRLKFLMIIGNAINCGFYYDGLIMSERKYLDKLSLVFGCIFIGDCIVALEFESFWYSSSNRIDLIAGIFSLIELVTFSLNPQISAIFRFMKSFNIINLVKDYKNIENMIETLIFCLPSLLNVGTLLLLIFFVYSILGVFLFGDIVKGEVIDHFNNFSNFGKALLLIFKLATGDDWFIIMFDCYYGGEECLHHDEPCGNSFSIVYFISYFIICTHIMLNLNILIIIQQLEEYHIREKNPIQSFKDNLETFKRIWSEFSQNSEGLNICQRQLIDFYKKLPEPLGFPSEKTRVFIGKEIMSMNLLGDSEGNIYFNELLLASMRRAFGTDVLNNAGAQIQALLKREEISIRKKIEKNRKKDIRKFSAVSSKVSSKLTSRSESFFGSFIIDKDKGSPFKTNIDPDEWGMRKNIINPIMEFFFVGMAFKSWKKFGILKLDKQLKDDDSLNVDESAEEENSFESSEENEEENDDFIDQIKENLNKNEKRKKSEVDFGMSVYIKKRSKSIGNALHKEEGEVNFLKDFKRKISNFFVTKNIKIYPEENLQSIDEINEKQN